jgi:hypothetical protein
LDHTATLSDVHLAVAMVREKSNGKRWAHSKNASCSSAHQIRSIQFAPRGSKKGNCIIPFNLFHRKTEVTSNNGPIHSFHHSIRAIYLKTNSGKDREVDIVAECEKDIYKNMSAEKGDFEMAAGEDVAKNLEVEVAVKEPAAAAGLHC